MLYPLSYEGQSDIRPGSAGPRQSYGTRRWGAPAVLAIPGRACAAVRFSQSGPRTPHERRAGVSVVHDHAASLGWDGHLLLLHRSEQERRSSLEAWVRRGLERGEKVIYTEVPATPAERSLPAVLAQRGLEVATATAEGRLVVLPPEDFYPPGGQAEVVKRALADGFPGVRLSADSAAALSVLTAAGYADAERSLSDLCRSLPVSALCQYDETATSGGGLRPLVSVHLGGVRTARLATGTAYGAVAVAGEIDISNEDLLSAVLDTATATAAGTLHVDLSGVTFLGAAGCRALLQGTDAFRRGGGRLVLDAARQSVDHLLRIVGIDRAPGVELAPTRD